MNVIFGAPVVTNGPTFASREFKEYRPPATNYRNHIPRSGFISMVSTPRPSRAAPKAVDLAPADLALGAARALAIKAARAADPAAPQNQVARLLRLAKDHLTAREIADATGLAIKSIGPLIGRINTAAPGSVTGSKQPGSNYRLYQWTGKTE